MKAKDNEISDESSDLDDDSLSEWELDWEECKKRTTEQWQACEPHSDEWNKANFFNSRSDIELLQRKDGKPLGPDGIHYTVAPTPLVGGFSLRKVTDQEQSQNLRLVPTDLGFGCPVEECGKRPLPIVSDYMPPEGLLSLPDTYNADVFSLCLWFWEVVILRGLIEGQV